MRGQARKINLTSGQVHFKDNRWKKLTILAFWSHNFFFLVLPGSPAFTVDHQSHHKNNVSCCTTHGNTYGAAHGSNRFGGFGITGSWRQDVCITYKFKSQIQARKDGEGIAYLKTTGFFSICYKNKLKLQYNDNHNSNRITMWIQNCNLHSKLRMGTKLMVREPNENHRACKRRFLLKKHQGPGCLKPD